MALLMYADAYYIFDEFDKEHSQKGVCLMNMANILLQDKKYANACVYIKDSIRLIERQKPVNYFFQKTNN